MHVHIRQPIQMNSILKIDVNYFWKCGSIPKIHIIGFYIAPNFHEKRMHGDNIQPLLLHLSILLFLLRFFSPSTYELCNQVK